MRLFLLKLALGVAALAGLAYAVDWGSLAVALRAADGRWVLAALALLPVNVGLEAYRFHRLVRAAVPGVPWSQTLTAVVGAYPLGLLTPGRVGDYAGRALYLRGPGPAVPAGTTTALTFAERTATLWCCIAAGAAALPRWLTRAAPGRQALWLAGGAVAVAAALAMGGLLLSPARSRRVLGAALPFKRLRPTLDALGAVPPREARVLLLLSAVRFGVFSTQFVLLVRAFDATTGLGWAAVGVAMVFFAKSAVPAVTLGDLGVREGAAVFFLGALGVPAAAAFDASLALFGVNLLLPALAGLPLVVRLKLGDGAAPASGRLAWARMAVRGARRP